MHTSFAEEELTEVEREVDDLLRTYEDAADRLEMLAVSNVGRRDIRDNMVRFVEARERFTIALDRVQ
jgi:hypothetical protein